MSEPTTDEQASRIVDTLLADPDPVRRYRTVQALQDGRLRDVTAVSMRQLRDALGSTDAAADALGISRQAVNELLAKAGAPGARADRNLRQHPAYRYGRYFDWIVAIADATEDEQQALRCYDLQNKAQQTTAVADVLATTAAAWLKQIRRGGARAESLAAELDQRAAPVFEWITSRTRPELNTDEQAEFIIGLHGSSAERRAERKRTRKE